VNLEQTIPCPSCGRAPVLVGAIWRCPSILCGWRAGEQRPTLRWYAGSNHAVNWLLGAASAEMECLQTQRDRAERRVGSVVAELVQVQARLDDRSLRGRIRRLWRGGR